MNVAIQGELGSFSHAAADAMLRRPTIVPCARFADVFDRLERRHVDAAVLPIENSLAGSVAENLDLLLQRNAFVTGEFRLRISHNLIAAPGVNLRHVRRILSHPVALEQCRELFRRHPRLQPEPFYDTAGAVKHVVERRLPDAAAIAGRLAARQYGGRILRAGIEDDRQNFTRFFLLRRHARPPAGADKTSIAFALKNVPGALFKALSVFALRDVDLSRIESRPVRGRPWEYVFFVDFLRGRDRDARNALHHLAEIADFVKILGIYPRA